MPQKTDPSPNSALARLWRSIVRDPLNPRDDRGRMRLVVNSLVLHLHPRKSSVPLCASPTPSGWAD